jgi:hypothetical protein
MMFRFWVNMIAKWGIGFVLVLVRIWLWTAWAFGTTAAMRMMDLDDVRSNVMSGDLYVLLAAITTYLAVLLFMVISGDWSSSKRACRGESSDDDLAGSTRTDSTQWGFQR